jgi:hypothetical protein
MRWMLKKISSTYATKKESWAVLGVNLPEFISIFQISHQDNERVRSGDLDLLQSYQDKAVSFPVRGK